MRWSYLGDCVAIPFFALLIHYFLKKVVLTVEEKVLLAFCVGGLAADLAFVFGVVG